nr:adenosylcobinamide-GDP ribazoletransferase [Archaeoglobus profundus]
MDLISFFTRIPAEGKLERVAKQLWALPLLALLTSALPMALLLLKIPIREILALIALYATIGLIHLDGLADFSDGLMAKGDVKVKFRAMKDVNVGIAGIFAVIVVILLQVGALRFAPFYAIFLAELNSKFSILLSLSVKKPLGEGLAKFFMDRLDRRQFFVGFGIYIALIVAVAFYDRIALISALSLIVGLLTIKIALDNFKGLNGDCVGAVAEITRTSSLVLCAILDNPSMII